MVSAAIAFRYATRRGPVWGSSTGHPGVNRRMMKSFNREPDYLIGIGIPAGLLPGARHLGRDDLT